MKPSVSVCVVTELQDRIDAFLRAHLTAFACHNFELLVFCSENMTAPIRQQLEGYPKSVILSDTVKSGPSRKRNRLLEVATGEFVVFLDDDSIFDDPTVSLPLLLARCDASCDWLLWTARYRQADGLRVDVPPKSFSCGGPGSGIEWNQAFRRTKLVEAGGWHPDFCTGERWCSGGALKLMIKFRAMGCSQTLEPSAIIEHPAQLDDSDPSSCRKIRAYRYAIGAVLASEVRNLGWCGILSWVVRLGFIAPLRGLWDLLHARWTSGMVRLFSPLDAARGAVDWARSRADSAGVVALGV